MADAKADSCKAQPAGSGLSPLATRASYLVLKKTHVIPVAKCDGGAPSNQFEEKVSGFSGLPVLVDRKWPAVQFLHELRSAPEHRFAPPLDVAFSKAMPYFQVNMRVLRSAFVENFALDREQRQRAVEAIELCFSALDDDGDALIDWRELLCHLEVLYMPRRLLRERFRAMFRTLTDHRHLLSLDRLWSLLCTFALPHQRELLAGTSWPVMASFVRCEAPVVVLDDADACRMLDLLRIHHRRGWAHRKEDALDVRVYADALGAPQEDNQGNVVPRTAKDHESDLAINTNRLVSKPNAAERAWIETALDVQVDEEAALQAVFATPRTLKALGGSSSSSIGGGGGGENGGRTSSNVSRELSAESYTLRALLQKLSWDRLAPETRVRIRAERVDETYAAFERINTKLRWAEARDFWKRVVCPHLLQTRFERWRAVAVLSIHKKQGAAFAMFRRKRMAMQQLGIHAERRKYHRWRKAVADRFSRRVHLGEAMRLWKDAHSRELRFQKIQIAKAKRLYSSWQLERIFHVWHREAHTRRRFRRIRGIWQRRLVARVFGTWSGNVRTLVEKRQFEEDRSRVRQQILEDEFATVDQKIAELRAQEAAEEKERQEELERERLAAIAEEQRWERERERAFAGYERRTVLKRQEDRRASHKMSILRREERTIERTFEAVMEKAMEDAKREAETFARTHAGKEQLMRDAETIQNDADRLARTKGGAAGAPENEDGAEWKKMYDPVFQSYFFYNPETGEKVTASALSIDEAMSIARTNYVSTMVQAAKEEVERLKDAEIHQKRLIWAGRKVQAAWRVRKARMAVHDMIRAVYIKRVDPYTGTMYYYNTQTRKSAWTKPLNLGPKKDLRPPEWVVRCDGDGQWSYQNNVTPWTSGVEKPAGFLPCLTCSLQLATIRCNTCEHHFCLDCFEAAHPLPVSHVIFRKPYAQLVKDRPEQCVMCKKAVASKFCIECGLLDFYCKRCYTMSHAKNPKRPHQLSAKQKHAPALDF
ncbi:Hypothetical Protein FCC1311_022262 [Hondaea fermentalgiana]|uniref:Uncharacterized protein n=1 Tax=Hondaea fermentalgiana TaxID=2315210 RepID=A0A2R5G4Q7_9STRA|nr:Hypothetical Protein FCC1311_022262 [Hondaea fermentalgiana]|eukprot:GBG26006.1 Hypothetical Protein FCC1311_022262 [Hondaea fermentalgiana]